MYAASVHDGRFTFVELGLLRQKPERSCIDRPSGDRREGLGSEGSFGEQGGDDCHPKSKTHGSCFAADGASAAAAPSAEVSGVFDDFETASADFSGVFDDYDFE